MLKFELVAYTRTDQALAELKRLLRLSIFNPPGGYKKITEKPSSYKGWKLTIWETGDLSKEYCSGFEKWEKGRSEGQLYVDSLQSRVPDSFLQAMGFINEPDLDKAHFYSCKAGQLKTKRT